MAAETVLRSLISEPGVADVQAQPGTQTLREAKVRAIVEAFPQYARAVDAVPQNFYFGGMYDAVFRLRKPIPVRTERDSAGISVVWDEVSEFGHGNTFSEAVDDFGRSVFELYKSLLDDDVTLGSDLLNVRHKLEEFISVRPR